MVQAASRLNSVRVSALRCGALLVLLMGLAACAVRPVPTAPPEPVEIAADSPAASLLQAARAARSRGDLSAAGRYLERALSMGRGQDTTVLYRELADLRLEEDQPRAAEGLAMRALRESPANPAWQAELWELVAVARARQGDEAGRDAARDNAERLRAELP
ncbi:MAG: hypothetical protein LAT61_04020 [Alcanivorax sp.]|nr:hypothetical protein [Alcanivorax sp.]